MLSARHRRQLAAIERQLAAEDPDLARSLRDGLPARRRLSSSPLAWLLLGVLTAVAGAVELGAAAVVAGVVTALVSLAVWSSPGSATTTRSTNPPASAPPP